MLGLNALTQRILPGMRQQRRGHIFNMSSLGGLVAFAATGYYHATKFAVEALSESLSHELAPLGIRVTIVEPGAFRTDWAGRSMIEAASRIDDYAETAGKRRAAARAVSGKPPGDPARAAFAIIGAYDADEPPMFYRVPVRAAIFSVRVDEGNARRKARAMTASPIEHGTGQRCCERQQHKRGAP